MRGRSEGRVWRGKANIRGKRGPPCSWPKGTKPPDASPELRLPAHVRGGASPGGDGSGNSADGGSVPAQQGSEPPYFQR